MFSSLKLLDNVNNIMKLTYNFINICVYIKHIVHFFALLFHKPVTNTIRFLYHFQRHGFIRYITGLWKFLVEINENVMNLNTYD